MRSESELIISSASISNASWKVSTRDSDMMLDIALHATPPPPFADRLETTEVEYDLSSLEPLASIPNLRVICEVQTALQKVEEYDRLVEKSLSLTIAKFL